MAAALASSAAAGYAVVPCRPDLIARSEPTKQQVLWVGCSDSGFEETTILDLSPDEVIVLRDIGNMALGDDLACASMVQYALEFLKVKHIVVCGHYGCGLATATCPEYEEGAMGPWFSKLEKLRAGRQRELQEVKTEERDARFVELNVVEQMRGLQQYPEVAGAIRERGVRIHGLVYDSNANESVQIVLDEPGPW